MCTFVDAIGEKEVVDFNGLSFGVSGFGRMLSDVATYPVIPLGVTADNHCFKRDSDETQVTLQISGG